MKVFLVGGAVRDELLQRPVKDRDFVVVGATPEEMLSLGFEQVGADFPVFLHPETREEYALARTERKSGNGYGGFTTEFDPSITLVDDLRRRDLTINAMAKDLDTGEIIDPFGGQADLEAGVLRHVSPAFAEDPLRVLRVARFRARYGFKLANATKDLMLKLVMTGELNHLTPERVWLEMEKGLSEANPTMFITTLMSVEAWGKLFPAVRVGGAFHRFRNAVKLPFNGKLMLMFSQTPALDVRAVLEKYKASADTERQVMNMKHFEGCLVQGVFSDTPTPEQILSLLKRLDAFRRPEDFYAVMEAASMLDDDLAMVAHSAMTSFETVKDIGFDVLTQHQQLTLKGVEIGRAIDVERLKKLGVNT